MARLNPSPAVKVLTRASFCKEIHTPIPHAQMTLPLVCMPYLTILVTIMLRRHSYCYDQRRNFASRINIIPYVGIAHFIMSWHYSKGQGKYSQAINVKSIIISEGECYTTEWNVTLTIWGQKVGFELNVCMLWPAYRTGGFFWRTLCWADTWIGVSFCIQKKNTNIIY